MASVPRFIYRFAPRKRGKCELCGFEGPVNLVGLEDGVRIIRCGHCLAWMMEKMKAVFFKMVSQREDAWGERIDHVEIHHY